MLVMHRVGNTPEPTLVQFGCKSLALAVRFSNPQPPARMIEEGDSSVRAMPITFRDGCDPRFDQDAPPSLVRMIEPPTLPTKTLLLVGSAAEKLLPATGVQVWPPFVLFFPSGSFPIA